MASPTTLHIGRPRGSRGTRGGIHGGAGGVGGNFVPTVNV